MAWAVAVFAMGGATAQERGAEVRSLEVGTAKDQLALDPTPIPLGSGAVFVPCSSRPELEPYARVFRGDEVVARGPTGRRLIVPPGRYRVVIGQGPLGWRASRDIDVGAAETVTAEGFVGALRVGAVDVEGGAPSTVDYIIVSSDGNRVYGPATTPDDAEYTGTRTWLLPPGAYRIVPGSNPEVRRGGTAVVIPADARVRIRLLVDSGGDVVGSEPADYEQVVDERRLRVEWVVGGSLAFGQASDQLGSFSGQSVRLEAFTDFAIKYDYKDQIASLLLGFEQSWVALEPAYGQDLPFQKFDDAVKLQLLYAYRAWRVVGPYVRVTMRTSILPTRLVADGDTDIVTVAPNGTETTETVGAGDEIELMDYLAPSSLQEGAGLSVTAWDDRVFTFGVRAGFGARQLFYRDTGRYVIEESDGRLLLGTLDDDQDYGPEFGSWARLRLGEWFIVRTEVEGFVPLDAAITGDTASVLVFRFVSSAELRLADWASIVYRATLQREDAALDDLQFRHTLNVRFQYAIF